MSVEKTKIENLEADLVVIGGGGAGLPAALTAVESGTKNVIVLEKRFAPGGDGLRCNHIFAVESRLQKEAGSTLTADDMYQQALAWHHHEVNPRILRALIKKTADNIRWLEEKGAEFKLLTMGPMGPDLKNATTHVAKDMPMPDSLCSLGPMFRLLYQRCKEAGIRFLFHTSGKKIVRGADGKVSGVVAADNKGEEYQIKTGSVILCPGSFCGNKELLKKYFPKYYDEVYVTDGLLSNTGDGLPIAEEAGAVLVKEACTLIRHGGTCFDRDYTSLPVGFSGHPTSIKVNTRGQRFIDEGSRETSANISTQQPGKIGFALYEEQNILRFGAEMPMLSKDTRIPTPPGRIPPPLDYLAKEVKREVWVKKADTWEGIADWIGCDSKVLRATVDEYNSFCDRGYDEDFLKDPKFLVPLRTPPYYAVKFVPLMIESIGPVKVNERMEVVDKENNPIPGFFAAGVITCGWESADYGGTPGGTALGFSIGSGRIAAESAAKYVLGK